MFGRISLSRAVGLMHPYTSHQSYQEVERTTPELQSLSKGIVEAVAKIPKDFLFPAAVMLDPNTSELVKRFLEICADKIAHLN